MTCPNGHATTATDYCDVCGIAMPAATATPPAPAAPAAPAPPAGTPCPNCGADNAPDALFCEACGYDFTTGTMPRPLDPPAGVASTPTADAASPAPSVAPPLADGWVAEVWVDPDWYADQDSTDPLPSPGLPLVVPLTSTSILIGRHSQSRNIHPDVDLTSDNGISRRHAQLTTDGTRWWVEDLGSSNGTYVGTPLGGLPKDPVPPGEKRELGTDGRIYLGAWTRIVVRKAAPGEV